MFAFTFKGGWSPHLCVNCEVLEQDMIHAHGETIHQVTFHEPLKLPSASRISKQTKTRIQSKNTITLFHHELPCCMLFCSYSQKASTLRGMRIFQTGTGAGSPEGGEKMKRKNWQGLEYVMLGQLIVGACLQVYLVVSSFHLPWSYLLAGFLLTVGTFGTLLGLGMGYGFNKIITYILAGLAAIITCIVCILMY